MVNDNQEMSPQSGAEKPSLSILVADDEPPFVDMMAIMLKSVGHKVVATARSGPEAIRLAEAKNPDLIVMDIGMPGMDGITAAEQILARQSVPIIIVTGTTRDEAMNRIGRLKIQTCLIKPFSKEQLRSAITLAMIGHYNTELAMKKIDELNREIERSKTISDAVKWIVEEFGVDPAHAMEQIQAAARERSCSVEEAAQGITATHG